MIRFWHAFTVQLQKERAAQAQLKAHGHDCIVPSQTIVSRPRRANRRRTPVIVPIYPRHVFVPASDEIWAIGAHCRFVTGVLGFAGRPAKIPDAQMQRFLETLAQPIETAPQFKLQKGAGVLIKKGTFAHIQGKVEAIDGKRAKVLIELFSRSLETIVGLDDLEEIAINADSARKQWTRRSKSFRRESDRGEAEPI